VRKVALAASSLLLVAFVIPVFAAPSVEVSHDVLSAGIAEECAVGVGGGAGGRPLLPDRARGRALSQSWKVASEISVQNASRQSVQFESAGYLATFDSPGARKQLEGKVSVVESGGFVADVEIRPGATRVFHPVVRVDLRCDTTAALLQAHLTLVGSDTIHADADNFLEAAATAPVGPTGILGIAAVVGAVGMIRQHVSRRQRVIASDRSGE
jgi:hypothetical protein